MTIKCQRYHLVMRKFPGRRVPGVAEGLEVTVLPWHGPGQALLCPLPPPEPYQLKAQVCQRQDAKAKGRRHRG